MHARPVLQRTGQGAVYQVLDRGTRRALSRAAAVELLRKPKVPSQRTPFRWSGVARFTGILALFLICISPTALFVLRERGTVVAIIHLILMVLVSAAGWSFLQDGAWSYRQTYVAAYYGNLGKLTRWDLLSTDRVSGHVEDNPPASLRLLDARRWARWVSLAALVLVIWLAFDVCATILDCLWEVGWVTAVRPMTVFALTARVYGQVAWTLADSIPALDLPNSLHWTDPAPFRDSLLVDVVLLSARVAVFAPVIAWIINAYRATGFDPRPPATRDDVAGEVIAGLVAYQRCPDFCTSREQQINSLIPAEVGKWKYAISFASHALGEEEWPPDRVLEHVATQGPCLL